MAHRAHSLLDNRDRNAAIASAVDLFFIFPFLARLINGQRFIFRVPVVARGIWSVALQLSDAFKRTMMDWVEH